jgi:hypothetical protein
VLAKEAIGRKKLKLVIIIAAFILVISACTPSRISVDEYEGVISGEEAPEAPKTAEPVSKPDSGDESPQDVEVSGGVPADVPLMEGAYQIQAGRSGKNVVYQIDATI